MRLLFKLTPPTKALSFDYPYKLCASIHKWLGFDNPWHDMMSLYSFGWLEGGKAQPEGLYFPEGASWFVSSWDSDFLAKLLTGAYDNREVYCGMRVKSINVASTPHFHLPEHTFRLSGPALLKLQEEDGNLRFITYQDTEIANQLLTQSIRHKLEFAGLEKYSDQVHAKFKTNNPSAKTKLVRIKNIDNRASHCPIIVNAPLEVMRFIWLTGVGNSTGVGFGSIK